MLKLAIIDNIISFDFIFNFNINDYDYLIYIIYY